MAHLEKATLRGRAARQRAIGRNVAALDIPAMVANIDRAFRVATDDEVADGLAFYLDACHIGGDRRGAGMIAALSPGAAWPRNVAMFREVRQTGDTSHPFGDPIRKARAIRNGADPSAVLAGRKVRSFFANVADPLRHGAVTVDRHAYSLAVYGIDSPKVGRSSVVSDAELKALERPGTYAMVAACYRTVARRYGYRGHEMQAITWFAWRNRHAFDTGNAAGTVVSAHR